MFKWLEKWALQRVVKRVAEGLPCAKEKIGQIWAEHKDEIFEKVTEAIKKAVSNVIKKALEKQGVKVQDASNN